MDVEKECALGFADQCKIVWHGIKKGIKHDGCTAVPDLDFGADCCGEHDVYTRDATINITRAEANRRMRACIEKKGYRNLAWIYWAGVTAFGWIWWKKRVQNIVQFGPDENFA
jgi:hypothetical protein